MNLGTTIDIPDELFRESKATAALRGESLKEFFMAALQRYLDPVQKLVTYVF